MPPDRPRCASWPWLGLALLCWLVPSIRAAGLEGVQDTVLCAVAEDGAQAWISAERGLYLTGWLREDGQELELGSAGWPRFLPDGRFVYETGTDDGHQLTSLQVRVLDPGRHVPRAPRPQEPLGEWQRPPSAAVGAGVRVCVDAGHGGSDPGAVGNGLLEKDVNLDVALRLADYLFIDSADLASGGAWDVLLTRVDDSDVSLLQRVTVANAFGAESFVSIHANAFTDPAANGTETFAFSEGTTAASLRDRVHGRMLEAWGLTDRGTKTAGFYVLLNTSMPASLSEMGFVTNAGDALLLGDAKSRRLMARAHLFALQEHHGFQSYEPSLFTLGRGGTYGTTGKPALQAFGPLTPGSTLSMELVDARADAFAVLFFSIGPTSPTPFIGGTLYAFPIANQVFLLTDSAGTASGSGIWPGLPPGTEVWYQVGVVDPIVPIYGAALSDALQSVVP